ncbi:hypothetical protein [Brachybacterium sp. GPGPB12]|uniref:hypothetical protein n=1 Tax=Brachybacterium sp. GPGPB12 TaxID=3023517 RepID=UPI0031343F4B
MPSIPRVATRLETALADWGGTVLIAYHDRWPRRRWDGEPLELGDTDVHSPRPAGARWTG